MHTGCERGETQNDPGSDRQSPPFSIAGLLVPCNRYVSGAGTNPTVVTDESVHGDKDATKAYRCDPKENRLLVFPGDLLHGVVPGPSNKTKQSNRTVNRARLIFLSSSARLHVLRVRVLTWVCIVRAGEQAKSNWRPLICQ